MFLIVYYNVFLSESNYIVLCIYMNITLYCCYFIIK